MAMLEARGVSKVYQTRGVETVALRHVDLSIESGEFTALAGPSGSGKTTLLNLFGGLDAPTEGVVVLDGDDLGSLSSAQLAEERLRKLGFVFQAYNLIPVFSARENVEFVMELQGISAAERRRRAMAILEEVGLGELADRRPMELSGGQQQRVGIARALVKGPTLVLADEPTANLDSVTATEIMALMQRLNQERGTTFVFSTHDPLVMDHATRLIRLRDGRVESDERRNGGGGHGQ